MLSIINAMIEKARLFQLFLKYRIARLLKILHFMVTTANLRRFILSSLFFIMFVAGSGVIFFTKGGGTFSTEIAASSSGKRSHAAEPWNLRAKVILIIADLGSSSYSCEAALKLPRSFTLGFKAQSHLLGKCIDQAYQQGFESLIQLPLQGNEKIPNSWGARVLLVDLSGVNSAFAWLYHHWSEGIGIDSIVIRIFTKLRSELFPKWEGLNKKNILVFKENSNNEQTLTSLGDFLGVETNVANIIIDEELDEERIRKNLLRLEEAAIANGKALGFVRAFPFSQHLLEKWSVNLNPEVIEIVPASSLFASGVPYILSHSFPDLSIQQAEQTPVETEINEYAKNFQNKVFNN